MLYHTVCIVVVVLRCLKPSVTVSTRRHFFLTEKLAGSRILSMPNSEYLGLRWVTTPLVAHGFRSDYVSALRFLAMELMDFQSEVKFRNFIPSMLDFQYALPPPIFWQV